MTIIEKFNTVNFDENALMLEKINDYKHYDSTPVGAKIFASMGVDGIHYCVMPKDNDITLENSPIYCVSPMDFSERTVVWTAKNFHDFISVSIELKNFWLLPCIIGTEKEEFMNTIETSLYEFDLKEEIEKKAIMNSLDLLKNNFNTDKIKDIYSYVQTAYRDESNHAQLTFSDPDIVEDKKGIYHFKHYCK